MRLSPRVVSLVPSGTDIVVDMGLGRHLVGLSHACDHPAVRGLPVVTAPWAGDAPGQASLPGRRGYRLDAELVASLEPDVVLARTGALDPAGAWPGAAVPPGAELVLLAGTSMAGLADDLVAVSAAMGVKERADKQVAAVDAAHTRLRRQVARLDHPRVVALEWADPPVVAGHWVAELVGIAGGEHLLTGPSDPPRRSSWEEVAEGDPDVVVFLPYEQRIEAAAAQARALLDRPDVAGLRAVADGRLWAADAARLFSRLTPAVVTAAPVLAAIFHPGRYPPVGRRRAVPIRA